MTAGEEERKTRKNGGWLNGGSKCDAMVGVATNTNNKCVECIFNGVFKSFVRVRFVKFLCLGYQSSSTTISCTHNAVQCVHTTLDRTKNE